MDKYASIWQVDSSAKRQADAKVLWDELTGKSPEKQANYQNMTDDQLAAAQETHAARENLYKGVGGAVGGLGGYAAGVYGGAALRRLALPSPQSGEDVYINMVNTYKSHGLPITPDVPKVPDNLSNPTAQLSNST